MNSIKKISSRSGGAGDRRKKSSMGTLVGLMVLLMLLISTTQGAFSQGAPDVPVWEIQTIDDPDTSFFYNMTDRSLDFNDSGLPCIAFGGDGLNFSCYNNATSKWETQVVDDSLRVGEYAALKFNNDGYPFITYYDAYNGRLKMAYKIGAAAWTVITVPTPILAPDVPPEPKERTFETEARDFLQPWLTPLFGPDPSFGLAPNETIGVGKHSSLDFDDLNRLHISYFDEINGALWYAKWDAVTWDFTELDDYHDQYAVGLWTSIVVDPNEYVHISYMDEKYDDLKYAVKEYGGGWEVMTVDNPSHSGHQGTWTSIDVMPKEDSPFYYPVISYLDFATNNLNVVRLNRFSDWNWEQADLSVGGMVGWYSSILTVGNQIHVSYYDADDGNLMYARCNNGWASSFQGCWDVSEIDTSVYNVGLFTSIARSRYGMLGISYYNSTLGILQFKYRNPGGGGWSVPLEVYGPSQIVGLSSSLVLNSAGTPYVSYLDASLGRLKYAHHLGLDWSISVVQYYPFAGTFSSIAVRDEFFPHIAYYETLGGNLRYAHWNGNWNFYDVDRTYDVGQHVSMALDSTGYPHISYYDATYDDLEYAWWDIGANRFLTDTLDYVDEVGKFSSLAMDINDRPSVSYYDEENGRLLFLYKTILNAWVLHPDIVDDPVGVDEDVGQYTSLAYDNAGNPHISYYDVYNGNLKYAVKSGGVWTKSIVDCTNLAEADCDNDVGKWSSLEIDPATNDRHLAYFDADNKVLKYAYWDASGPGPWEISVVPDTGDYGYYCSLDLNGSGEPAITYFDNSRGDLKIAFSYALPLAPFQLNLPLIMK